MNWKNGNIMHTNLFFQTIHLFTREKKNILRINIISGWHKHTLTHTHTEKKKMVGKMHLVYTFNDRIFFHKLWIEIKKKTGKQNNKIWKVKRSKAEWKFFHASKSNIFIWFQMMMVMHMYVCGKSMICFVETFFFCFDYGFLKNLKKLI